MEQVFFNVPLSKLEPIFKRWMKEAQAEMQTTTGESNTEQADRLLTVHEAAEFLKLSPATVYGKVHRNELPYMKRGKKVYFSSRELMEYLKAGRVKTNTEIAGEAEKLLSNK